VRFWTEWTENQIGSCWEFPSKYFAWGRMRVTGGQISLREHLLTEQVLICRFSRAESIRIMQLRWACSSAGRASALQAGGRRFDPGHVHQLLR
jgi:hypothetical protein